MEHRAKRKQSGKLGSKLLLGVALGALLFALSSPAESQQTGKVSRIGFLVLGSFSSAMATNIEAFRQGLRDLGYIEGKNIGIDYRYAEGKSDRLAELARELVRTKVAAIVTGGTAATRAAKEATEEIPIVVGSAGDLVREGLVDSLARPGGNITGSIAISPDLSGKRLELLKEVVPEASQIAVIWHPSPWDEEEVREAEIAARAMGVKLQSLRVRSTNEIQGAFATMTKERVNALVIIQAPFTGFHRKQLVELAVKHRLPSMCDSPTWTEGGCLVSYGPNRSHLYRRAATFVDKILKGAKPAELPVEQPTKFELVINLKTAKQIGLTIPPNVLARANRVIR